MDSGNFFRLAADPRGWYLEIELRGGAVAKVDLLDLQMVCGLRWYIQKPLCPRYASYARSKCRGKTVLLHRLILGARLGSVVDREDGDGLNCRRYNLRVASHSQNMAHRHRTVSKTGFKGVRYSGRRSIGSRYQAELYFAGQRHLLGSFPTAEQAAAAYDAAAIRICGPFAVTNKQMRGSL